MKYKVVYYPDTDTYTITENNNVYYMNNKLDISSIVRILNNPVNEKLKKQHQESLKTIDNLKEKLRFKGNRISKLEKQINIYEDKLNGIFPLSAEPIKSPFRLNLRDYFKIPEDYVDKKWDVGGLLVALDYYKTNDVKILHTATIGEYQGEYFAVLEVEGYIFLWRGSFGSCDVCDVICNENILEGYETILSSVSEGNTLQFYNKTHARNYLNALEKSRRYNHWKTFPKELLWE